LLNKNMHNFYAEFMYTKKLVQEYTYLEQLLVFCLTNSTANWAL